MRVGDLSTPALVVDVGALDHNIDTMASVRPGPSLRSHVKAHKCTALARHLAERSGSDTFCVATVREAVGLAAAGLGRDILLANEVVDPVRLRALADAVVSTGASITVAVDSPETVGALADAARTAPLAALVDVNVGLPRCGVPPEAAGELAERARAAGLVVRGVMGYEGHVVGNPDRPARVEQVAESMRRLRRAHDDVGGLTSAGGTGTWDLHEWVDEVQAGSFLLMDTHYGRLGLPFRQAVSVIATVVSVNAADGFVVADAGLKAFGMDHGEPTVVGHTLFFTSDEHATIVPSGPGTLRVGDRVALWPGHVDPTLSQHEVLHVADGAGLDAEVLDAWPIDLRNW